MEVIFYKRLLDLLRIRIVGNSAVRWSDGIPDKFHQAAMIADGRVDRTELRVFHALGKGMNVNHVGCAARAGLLEISRMTVPFPDD